MKRAMLLTVLMAFGGWSGCKVNGQGVAAAAIAPVGGVVTDRTQGGAVGGGAQGSAGSSGSGSVSNQTSAPGGDTETTGGASSGGGMDTHGGNLAAGSGGAPSNSGAPGGAGTPGSVGAPGVDGGSAGNSGQGDTGTPGTDAPAVSADAPGDASVSGADSHLGSGGAPGPRSDAGSEQNDGIGSDDSPGSNAGLDSRDGPMWRLVWSDEFNLAANTGADTTKWNIMTWEPNTVNAEKQKYTSRLANIFHDGQGHLVLRGLHDSWTNNGTAYPYTSGRLQTGGELDFKFGRVEVRAKLPAGQGSFPAILLMGATGRWPQSGEIGLMEQWGQDKSWLYCSTYAGGASGDIGSQKVSLPNATTASSDFHVYALDWYADHMVFFIDDQEVARSDFDTTSPFYTNTFNLVLDVAIGGNMGGTIDDEGGFPMDMVLDYVRVYAQ